MSSFYKKIPKFLPNQPASPSLASRNPKLASPPFARPRMPAARAVPGSHRRTSSSTQALGTTQRASPHPPPSARPPPLHPSPHKPSLDRAPNYACLHDPNPCMPAAHADLRPQRAFLGSRHCKSRPDLDHDLSTDLRIDISM
jgi:hypothetical protein